jgi:hypothetical protein
MNNKHSITIRPKKINNMLFIEILFLEGEKISLSKTYRPTENMQIQNDIYSWLGIE